ncbi:MAG TPA: hypothetical protein VFN30_10455 [Chitinophagaceae bacterium]|nr:hypothetical protein [Chitinophagaceae bacterium]
MKKNLFVIILVTSFFVAQAQDEKGFKKENLFTGGNISLSFGGDFFVIGGSPIFGYKLSEWADAGVVANITYTSQRDYFTFDDKLRQTTYGGGIFTRLFPVNFLFAQAQFEHNFTTAKYIPSDNSYLPFRETVDANSLLVGAGYTQGRQPGSNTFFYVAILWDVIKDENSPYVSIVNNGVITSVRSYPIIRAGFNIGLFEGRNRR